MPTAARKDATGTATTAALPSSLDGLVGYRLKRAYLRVLADFRDTLAGDALSPRTFSVLVLVSEQPGISQSDVARALGIERSGVVALVDELAGRGLVRRVPRPDDRRTHALQPTPAGRRLCTRAVDAVQAHETRVLAVLSGEERAALLGMLRRIQDSDGNEA